MSVNKLAVCEAVVKLSQVLHGDYVRRTKESKTTFIRGDYDRATKKYSLIDAADASREIFLSGFTNVHVGFTY